MDSTKSSPAVVVSAVCALLIGQDVVCRAQMFETAKPLPSSSEGKVYSTGSLGVKTGKDGVSRVYETGVLGMKTGKPIQVIDNKR